MTPMSIDVGFPQLDADLHCSHRKEGRGEQGLHSSQGKAAPMSGPVQVGGRGDAGGSLPPLHFIGHQPTIGFWWFLTVANGDLNQ